MFETVLASIGLGTAKIDLRLDHPTVRAGEEVTGHFVVTGGKAEQDIEGLSVYFMMESCHATSLSNIHKKIASIGISKEEYELEPGETKEVPFSFHCPEDLPPSSINTKYFFLSNLEIKHAIDAHDRDYLQVKPAKHLENFYQAIEQLGFHQTWEGSLPLDNESFGQLLQYRPTSYFYRKFEQVGFYFENQKEQKELTGIFDITLKENDHSNYLSFLQSKKLTHSFLIDEETLKNVESTQKYLEEMIRKDLAHS
ncbi:sporulation-control protein [Croceifilum oryzae]|uniref:Sporulation-control protein n=1 Tax=Croceifilum oryzae TaxID=1553429 RepID=A0AAJ1TH56_9BACL|nr:sporulation protein [Croceifilum oryzae]MDQ0416462.1 sporulation-control protein [Croceifilum oryzae]